MFMDLVVRSQNDESVCFFVYENKQNKGGQTFGSGDTIKLDGQVGPVSDGYIRPQMAHVWPAGHSFPSSVLQAFRCSFVRTTNPLFLSLLSILPTFFSGDVESAVELLDSLYTSPDNNNHSMSFVFRKVLEEDNDKALDKCKT